MIEIKEHPTNIIIISLILVNVIFFSYFGFKVMNGWDDIANQNSGVALTTDATNQNSEDVLTVKIIEMHKTNPLTMAFQTKVAEGGEIVNLTVDPGCNFYNEDLSPITSDSLKAGDIIQIRDKGSDGKMIVAFSIVKIDDSSKYKEVFPSDDATGQN